MVNKLQKEKLIANSDHTVLRQIASNTNGKFFKLNQIQDLITTIENRETLPSLKEKKKITKHLLT